MESYLTFFGLIYYFVFICHCPEGDVLRRMPLTGMAGQAGASFKAAVGVFGEGFPSLSTSALKLDCG